ncbi:MAG: nadB, partial [Bacteroidetes bacterium]|nr:nadB [Bacteroidota bacterium]
LGGASAIFRNTTNPRTTTGDGVALAYRAHCLLQDMEFIQFHPTAIFTENDKSYLISEAVRGEGAYLLNENGERFMTAIHESAELAPRDIVARSIYKQILNQEKPYVYLSLKHLNPERIKERFPNIFEKCRQLGIDMTDKIPVAPAAHYMVGGVRTDNCGQTNLPGLYVCGELASTGIMGANRLASNSLLECLVFGYRAVEECERASCESREKFDKDGYAPLYSRDSGRQKDFTGLSSRISEIMTVHAGIIRNEQLLYEGLNKLEKERANFVRGTNEIFDMMGENLIIVAELIIRSAINRRESRGGHFREDYPTEDKSFIHHIVQQSGEEIFTISVNENTVE